MYSITKYFLFISIFYTSISYNNIALLNVADLNPLTIMYCNTKPEATERLSSIIDHIVKKGYYPGSSFVDIYQQSTTDKAVKTVQQTVMTKRGIQIPSDTKYVFMYSRGYAHYYTSKKPDHYIRNGGGLLAAYKAIRDHVITINPESCCITFDYRNESEYCSLAQNNEIFMMHLIYNEIIRQAPHAKIIIVGDCLGGLIALQAATKNLHNVHALILESPLISIKELTQQWAKEFTPWIAWSDCMVYSLFKWYFPHYRPENDRLENIHTIRNMHIFIGHRKNDTFVTAERIAWLIDGLNKYNTVWVQVIDDNRSRHSKITQNPLFQSSVNCFKKQAGIPYNIQLAEQNTQEAEKAYNAGKDSHFFLNWAIT